MPATRTAPRRPDSVAASRDGRAFIAFGLLAATSAIVPSIVFSAGYLIIPYSRPVVLLLETLPALVAQLTLPYALTYVPWAARPCFIAVSWAISAAVSLAAPPNVPPPLRVFATILTSVTTAAADLSFVPHMRYYGRAAVGGWALGTGLGGAAAAAIPLLSHFMGVFVRRSLWYVLYMTMAMLVAYFAVLPKVQLPLMRHVWLAKPNDSDVEEAESLLEHEEGHQIGRSLKALMRRNAAAVRPLIRSSALPLAIAFASDALLFPASLRAQPRHLANPGELFTFQARFGLAHELGSLLGGLLVVIVRPKNLRQMTLLLGTCGGLLFLNGVVALVSAPSILLALAFFAGAGVGGIYLDVLGNLLDKQIGAPVPDCDFAVSVLLGAKTAGKVIGSTGGYGVEALLCGSEAAARLRWCSCTR